MIYHKPQKLQGAQKHHLPCSLSSCSADPITSVKTFPVGRLSCIHRAGDRVKCKEEAGSLLSISPLYKWSRVYTRGSPEAKICEPHSGTHPPINSKILQVSVVCTNPRGTISIVYILVLKGKSQDAELKPEKLSIVGTNEPR